EWESVPEGRHGRSARMLVQTRRARLLAQKGVATQRVGRVRPGDAAAYRIAVTRLDQDSAAVLMDIVGLASLASEDGARFKRAAEDHWRYSPASPAASGRIEIKG